ncbi:HlyD family secretion protein [Tenacibaculum aestuariivivum]|uniref:HlyD family secretion protein n=1 Tax=Tenacibaculum aestuariivivum TaxID=2006131 RepID=UPI003AB41B0B
MKDYKYLTSILIVIISFFSCKKENDRAAGYGNFEATEITISAENNGKIMQFNVNEGELLKKNQFIGYIDTIPLALKREQLIVSRAIIGLKSKGILSQINILNAQLKVANTNRKRIENLIVGKAGIQKQLDDILGEINILKKKIRSIQIQNAPVINELKTITVQLKQIDNQITKSKIINPVEGTVLTKYSEPNEITLFGKPLYKIADLNTMLLRVYVSQTQLASIKIRQEVTVKIDDVNQMKSYKGIINWIASEAEFTPKIIQTKEERIALVYAVKIAVKNDGSLKIGMPAEMWINDK